jgi:8-oxo-dGTP diphosphatase
MAAQVHQQDMKHHMTLRDCVAFILIKGDQVLAEKRKLTKQIDPGAIALPGGRLENGESPEQALYRESHEELGIVPCSIKYICTLLHRAQEFQRIHYFAIEVWEGTIENNEAESLRWVPIAESKEFDIDVDRIAMSEYLRVYAS